ncbi:sialate O-acetylesterase [Vibrio profundum]|uniref:sialate O-acetylesterase n=1 Tax=Vibrio profundum TaxID=2910247 RepID=UPI003D0C6B62
MMKNNDIFLLMGQSNMAGRGVVTEVSAISDSKIRMLRDQLWQPAVEPLHQDKPDAGVGLAMSFAKQARLDKPERAVSLIPTAVGSTSLDEWSQGPLYEHALRSAKEAMSQGRLRAALWHQGESDSGDPERANSYAEKLTRFIEKIRRDLGEPNLPFIAGELPHFLQKEDKFRYTEHVNQALRDLSDQVPHYQFVSAQGLTANPDIVHYDAKSLRTFGERYFDAYLRSQHD